MNKKRNGSISPDYFSLYCTPIRENGIRWFHGSFDKRNKQQDVSEYLQYLLDQLNNLNDIISKLFIINHTSILNS